MLTVLLTVLLFFTQTWKTTANSVIDNKFDSILTFRQDTIPFISKDTSIKKPILHPNDSLTNSDKTDKISINDILNDTTPRQQRVDTFALKIGKDSLSAPVNYEAEDSAVIMVQDKKIYLYGKTKTTYDDVELTAPKVEIDQQTSILTATYGKDSTGEVTQRAVFVQGDTKMQSDTIRYNFKTQKGLTKNTFTQQQEIFIQGDNVKKVGENLIYAKHGVFTTCNLDHPHFGFRYDKIKVINKKVAVSGPVHPEFEGVPIPVYLPFGFFPMNKGRHGGFLPPQFTTNDQFGVGLEGLGYYLIPNNSPYFDITLRGNIYSYGGWSFDLTPTYRKRYRYQGSMNFSLQSTKFNFKGDPDFSKTKTYSLRWSHSVDSRARPGTTFSASVNLGSTKYNQLVPNSTQLNFQNQLSSSITYSKTWVGKPYNLSISANHSQNNNTRLVTVNLPDIGLTVSTLYPFQRKEMVGTPKWYEKLGVAYTGRFTNSINFYDTAQYGQNGRKSLMQTLLDTANWGAQHNIPITLSLPPVLGGKVMISPGVSYSQNWLQSATQYEWNSVYKKVDSSVVRGFNIEQRASVSLGFSTAVFGTFKFRNSRLIAVRHVARPTLSFSYTPDLNKKFIKEVKIDTTGKQIYYNAFGGAPLPYSIDRRFAGMNFTFDNNLEMKMKSRKDTTNGGIKKIKLVDGYGFSTSYNLIADSFNLAPFSFYLRSTLFEKINITASTILDPYQKDNKGFRLKKFAWEDGRITPGRLTNGSLSVSTSFKSKPKDADKEKQRQQTEDDVLNDPLLAGDRQRLMDYARQNPNEFVDFNIPWDVNLGLSVYFSEQLKSDFSGYEKKFSANLNFGGNFNLTPKWKFGVNGYYNIDTRDLQTFTMNISREMHCWQMSIGVTPVGLYRSFNITISPKSSILQDLKINRNRYFYTQ